MAAQSPLGSPRSTTTAGHTPIGRKLADGAEKVWVGVRLRPLLQHEVDNKETVVWRASGQGTLTCLADERNAHSYQYDRVFADSCSSEEVYATAAQPMVLSAMEGYNCTLFVYGQTGSGKTTTMRSFMHQAARDIFGHIARTRNREFVLKMSAIEVYNEVVHDLFADGETNLKINDDRERGPVVVDLTEHGIESEEHLLKMLKAVEGRRQVRETKMNQKSSRSHMVVRLYVESRLTAPDSDDEDCLLNDDSSVDSASAADRSSTLQPVVLSTMNFVDLAGSERLSQAEETDKQKAAQKFAETTSINVSLMTLGKVIRALGKRGEHVPYRESNLTRILQPSLAGNSRMAIVCTLSPGSGSVDNSRGTLNNFANHAKSITMRPVVNEVRNDKAEIHTLELRIRELERQLAQRDRRNRELARAKEREQTERVLGASNQALDQQLLERKDAELKAKEEQVRRAEQERDEMTRQLNRLKNVILRGGLGVGSPAQVGVRRSFDGADTLSAGGNPNTAQPRAYGAGSSAAALSDIRRSWNPSATSPLERERPSAGKPASRMGQYVDRSVANPPRLLLECLLPPGVRDTISKLGGEEARPTRSEGANVIRPSCIGPDTHGSDLRAEIGKLQGPEGAKAQKALSELQAEVRCLRHQPAAAEAVLAAAAATPETADHWIAQLTAILGRMEQRQREQSSGGQATGSGPMATDDASADTSLQERRRAHASVEEEAIERVRSEVARLQRMTAANNQTKHVLESVGKAPAQEGNDAEAPAVVERLQMALQEASALENAEDELAEDQGEGPSSSGRHTGAGRKCPQLGGAATTSQQRSARTGGGSHSRRRRATWDDHEVTSGQRYDPGPGDNITTAGVAAHNPVRLSGSKLPRPQSVCDDDEDATPLKSPRRCIQASPHDSAAAVAPVPNARVRSTTPNSRIPRPAGCVAASAGRQQPEAQAAAAEHRHDGSPQASADADAHTDEVGLRRMPTPSVSMNASDAEPISGGHRTASASSRGALRCDAERTKRIISREKDAIHSWYANEVARLKAAYQQQAQVDVGAMRDAVSQYRGMFEEMQERVERLTMHKQVLVKQVLQLELTLNEAAQQAEENRAELERLKEERDKAQQEAQQAKVQAQAERAKALQEAMRAKELERLLNMNEQDEDGVSLASGAPDGWPDPPTSTSLLLEICDLWHQLHIPLEYRSRFFQLFRHKELIYLQMEECRLTNRMQQLRDAEYLVRSKQMDKAKKALDLERKVLAQGLRGFDDARKEELYTKWGVKHPKHRKSQLVKKLWDPSNTRDLDGMEACANLVVALAGSDAMEQFVQLVFGNRAEANARPTQVGARVAMLFRRVTTPRMRKGGPPAAPTTSAATSAAGTSPTTLAPGNGGVTPRRQSSSILNMMGRMGSLLGHPGGQRPQQSLLGQVAAALPASAASTPRNTGPLPTPIPAPHQPDRAAAGSAGAGTSGASAQEQGPLTRALGPPMSARGPAPLPPPHPGAVGVTPPMSARGRPTYGGPLRS